MFCATFDKYGEVFIDKILKVKRELQLAFGSKQKVNNAVVVETGMTLTSLPAAKIKCYWSCASYVKKYGERHYSLR